MFTSTLRDFIALGVEQYKLDPSKVLTFMGFGLRLLREHNVDVNDLPEEFEPRRLAIVAELKKLIALKPGLKGHLECILVDEIQDCLADEIELFCFLGKNVFFVGDNRQRIYKGDEVIGLAASKVSETIQLKFHYRNGRKICKAADVVGKTSGELPISPDSNYDETKAPSSVHFLHCDDEEEIVQTLEDQVVSQLKAYPDERIAIACPRGQDVGALRTRLESSAIRDSLIPEKDGLRLAEERRVFLCKTHSLKGTEFRAVNLVHMEGMSKLGDAQKRISYTAFTRAKTVLAVYWKGKLPPHLQAVRAAFEDSASKVDLDGLFGGGDE
ncbi:hypothetical protein BHS04_18560 [Myxococcus xanthus]|nr:hypothetical protein BHS04_18560 [Myxococcus xanthus]